MSAAEWWATIFSMVYLVLAIYNKPVCFVFGIISSALWGYVVFNFNLIFDTGLQVFYVVMSIVGLYRWMYGGKEKKELPITVDSIQNHVVYIVSGCLVSYLLFLSSNYIEIIDKPLADAVTTVFLIIGTFLLVERKLYSWIYLVVADIGYICIYADSGLWLFVGMMAIYSVAGIWGFFAWKKEVESHVLT